MERRPWTRRLRQPPVRFRDPLPQSPAHLPPPRAPYDSLSAPGAESSSTACETNTVPSTTSTTWYRRLQHVFTTRINVFGLFRRYRAAKLPSHDPEEHNSLAQLSDIPSSHHDRVDTSFHPYPNRNSFRLGDWYWNGGMQKSQSGFKELIAIIGDPDFRPADVQNVKWNNINDILIKDDQEEWLDEDAGWTRTPVTISVPYQARRGVPLLHGDGPKDFEIGHLYHRSLVSVIREKLSNPADHPHFHYEPFELNWQPQARNSGPEVRTYGELYTSPAFADAHRELQEMAPEPGCDLQRVVVALMFWSDATQLTSFSDAQLWPLYLFFGNESKYRRSRPSSNLCEHIAYFQKVRVSPTTWSPPSTERCHSFLRPLRISRHDRQAEGKVQALRL